MSCKYFVNGQLVDENQLKEMLNNGLLDNLIKDGKVDISGFKVDDSKLLKQTTTTQRTTRIPVQKLRDILANEIKTRQGYPLNMLSALELNEAGDDFKIPLWANGAYAAKFESLLTALVTNKVVKQKFPGFSGVLGSEEGFRTKPTEIKEGEDLLSYSGITFTGNFDPATGLQPMRYDAKNKKILPAQVIVPFKFRDEQGNIIPIENFYLKNEKGQLILGDNGQKLLDPNKFPEKLLKLFGFRIPTQGRNSMAAVEIVGFVPEVNGDLILAPRDFTRQMGSDFDVDKMYTYMYNHYYDTATGKLHTNFLGDKKKIKTLIDVTKAKLNSIRDEFKVSKETRKLIDNYINGRLDEDADQEAVIQEFLNANVSSALAKELDNTLDRLRVLNRSYKASRQNVILDNHLRVMTSTNSEVINSIIALDSFGDFTALAKEVNEAREKAGLTPAFTTILSDSYQKMKYINATAGKDGVGSFSVDSTFNANVQGKGLVYKNLDKQFDLENATAEDVLAANNVVTSFGNVSSKGDLSNPYTLKSQAILESIKKQGRKPTDKELINLKKKSTIIRYLQSTAVDNEKSQILDKLNLNSNTFDCVRALVQLGFEEKDIVGLLTQEIVWEYVTALKDAQSSLSPYTPDVQNAIFEKLQAKYDPSKKYSTLTIEEREALSSVSGEELMNDIKQAATKKLSLGTVTTDFNLKQLALLEKFQKLSNIGVELKVVQSSINTFNKGVPNTLIETQKKIQQAENLSISNVFNADKLLAEGTFQGEATKNGVYFADAIFSSYFPYQSNGYTTIAKELLLHIPRGSEKSVSAQAKLQAELSKEIRSYLFANSSSNLFLGDPSAFRKTLFIDTKKNQSLATIINKILETDLGIHNGFLNKLSTTLNSNGALSRVNFEAASGENFDERDIYAGFAELFTKDTPIGTFLQNGKQVEFTTRKLAQHLVAAGFLEGGNQGAKQYLKYIPMSYLKAIGFGDYLSNEALEYRDIFGGITDERGNPIQKYPSKFMIQYFQNNPEKARSVNAGTDIENVVKDKKKVLSFTINKDQEKFFLDTIVDEQGEVVSTFPKFVSMYESKKTYQLFMYNESAKRYESIPTTNGDYGFVAYNSNIGASNISLEINPNELPVSAPKTKISVVQNPKANQAPVSTPSPKLTSKERVKALLGELYLDDSVSDLNKQLIEIIDSLELPDNFTFKVNNTMAGKGSYQYSNSTLTINAAHKDHSSRNALATTINHELIHAFTGDVIKRFEAGDNTLTDVQKRLVGNLKGLQEKYITHLKQTGREAALQEFEDMYWAWKADQSLPIPKGISEFYGAIKLTEFVTMALTDTGFQQRLKAVVDEDGRSMWDSIKEVLMGIINSLGFNVEPGTALYGAVGNSLELLRNGQNVSASQKISLSISLDFNSAVGNNETMLDINSNGANVGNVVYGISNNIATISATTVNPDYRRQGVAREAYIKLGDSLLRNNIKLQSGDLNEQSTGLWQNLVSLGKAVDLGNGTYEYVNKAITPVSPIQSSTNVELKKLLEKPYKGYENGLWYWFVEKAKLLDPSKVESIKNAKDYHTAYLIGSKIKNTPESDILYNAIIEELRNATPQSTTLFGPETTINIYAGTGENAELSNFANRPFDVNIEVNGETMVGNFQTVEGAFQAAKLYYTTEGRNEFNDPIFEQLQVDKGASAKKMGTNIPNLIREDWDSDSSKIMKQLLLQSFQQNPKALENLSATGNAELTHTQDKGKWGTEFPKLLMEVRDELRGTQPSTQTVQNQTQDTYRYYGSPYTIVVENGVGVDVVGYKGKNVDKNKLLAKYNENPNVDPQTGNPFRTVAPSTQESVVDSEAGSTFEYDGKSIETAFPLTEGQEQALESLIDYVNQDEQHFITLQGAAGTGKTAVIGYLQKYFKGTGTKFLYMAPTHAATAELAFATVKTGNRKLPITIQSAIRDSVNNLTKQREVAFTKKVTDELGFSDNIIVIDEVSMLSSKEYQNLKQAIKAHNVKVIFMGDILQIPEVNVLNPGQKQVSLAFSEPEQLNLTEVKRTESDSILKVLTALRNNANSEIPVVENNEEIKYLSGREYNKELVETFKAEPEDSVVIAYTNTSVQSSNNKIREMLGRTGDLQKDDTIVGYLGYSSKQIEKGNIANSIRYTVTNVKKEGSVYNISVHSKKLQNLKQQGVAGVSGDAFGQYYQLSPSDAFKFGELTQEDFDTNNAHIANIFKELYRAKKAALANPRNWKSYYAQSALTARAFEVILVGGDYIYNPATDKMEAYNSLKHSQLKKEFPELYMEKAIDFGHAVTIHKSQGSTVKNVFFDATTLPEGNSSKLYKGKTLVGNEKHSLIYVAMSRASGKLVINKENSRNFYDLEAVQNKPFVPFDPSLLGDISEYSSPENSFDPDDYNALGDIFNNDESLPEDSPISRDKLEDYSLICGK